MPLLNDPVKLGSLALSNRIFMPPLTRSRANSKGVQTPLAEEYYSQRASAGLIISEATQISAQGKGYIDTPGIYNQEQITAWKKVTDAVHAKGGHIFCQLWHVGRISHVSLLPDEQQPVAPSAIRGNVQTFTADGMTDVSKPRALSLDEIKSTIQDYKNAADAAKQAGFDGIEIHGANGYLIDQFIRDKTNHRTDKYGGSIENRARFLFEVFEAVNQIWSADNIGVRLSPTLTFNDMGDSQPLDTFGYIYQKLSKFNIAYLHGCEGVPGMMENIDDSTNILAALRKQWDGFYIANGGYDLTKGQNAVESGYADAVSYGRPFIANPDLPERFTTNAPLNEPDMNTFYGGTEQGYTDYPFLNQQ